MTMNSAILQRRSFVLPMTTMSIIGHNAEKTKWMSHNLDFDIVCVADEEKVAVDNLALAVKTYIEFGQSKGWSDEIHFRAPQEFWDKITLDTPVKMGRTIQIDNETMLMVQADTNVEAILKVPLR